VVVNSSTSFTAVVCGGLFNLALAADSTVWGWGLNGLGELGNGSTTDGLVPQQVATLTGIVAIASQSQANQSLALKNDGTVWAWGSNYAGEVGDTAVGLYTTLPVQVNFLTDVSSIAVGSSHSMALKADGTYWAWGNNAGGEFGDGSGNNSDVPIQVPIDNLVALAGGDGFTIALKSDGTVMGWGGNSAGMLGLGFNSVMELPTAIPGISDVTAISAGDSQVLALKSDGTLWAWGSNGDGELGIGSNDHSYVPVQVSTLSDVVAIAAGATHSLAAKADGTLWAWGENEIGQLGTGSFTDSNVPVQVTGVCEMSVGLNESTTSFTRALFPNPTAGPFIVETLFGIHHVVVRDALGRMIQQVTMSGTRLEMDLTRQPAGMYAVTISTGHGSTTARMLKE
jgi:alpha-tubulin suppressor-like RCC1 family protein